ncbi:MAG: hypothetical protein KF799_14315 [Bdellovibrionales bacterium]|nr:hypothetical protein [Bdellovibrionales bacterium]
MKKNSPSLKSAKSSKTISTKAKAKTSALFAAVLFCLPLQAQRALPAKPTLREQQRAVRDARTHLPKMERVVCLLANNCRFPPPQTSEKDLIETGTRLRSSSLKDTTPQGVTLDVHLPKELTYLSPGSGIRVRAYQGEIVEIMFFREPLSRKGVVVYGEKPSEALLQPADLQPKWRFGFLSK